MKIISLLISVTFLLFIYVFCFLYAYAINLLPEWLTVVVFFITMPFANSIAKRIAMTRVQSLNKFFSQNGSNERKIYRWLFVAILLVTGWGAILMPLLFLDKSSVLLYIVYAGISLEISTMSAYHFTMRSK